MFLHKLGAGCNTPVAARAKVVSNGAATALAFEGRCLAPDGTRVIEVSGEASVEEATELGRRMAEEALSRGFKEIGALLA
jgi:porphobilinogen deaminase